MLRLIFFILVFSHVCFSQEDAWVYLTDKENVAASIANPISILTQEAIDRKNAYNIVIDERDVPVNENYISQLKNQSGISVLAKSKWFNAVHVRGTMADINTLLSLNFVDHIIYANKSLNTSIEPQDEVYKFSVESSQTNFNYGSASNQIEMFNGDKLHEAGYTGENMTVAVIDAGFPNVNTMNGFQRMRDAGKLLGTYDFFNRTTNVYTSQTSSHGTLVLSNMAGYVQNQYVGTAPDANYYLFITEHAPSENPVEESLWVEAAERADSLGVDVINTSLGYRTYDNPNYSHSQADMDGNTTFITKGANIAFEKGMLLITSAGNSGSSGVGAPADAAGVLSVGAVDSSGNYASFSSQGSDTQPTQKPDVVAQGAASVVINQNDIITTSNGTSFSSPTIAGGIVCLWQAQPNLSNTEIMQIVRESASQFGSPDFFLGYGIPDLEAALQQVLSLEEIQNKDELRIHPNPTSSRVVVDFSDEYETVDVSVFNVLGKRILETSITKAQPNIDVSSFSNGMYLLKIDAQNVSKTIKLIINH